MARDVAQRELDQAGFRITNLGAPVSEGDATKTDNRTVPRPAAGEGTAGTSFLAAAADHVHPAAPAGAGAVVIALDDPTQQATNGEAVIWETVVDFSQLPGEAMLCSVGALARASGAGTSRVELKLGGLPGRTDGDLALSFNVSEGTSEINGAQAEVAKPSGLALVKLIASTPSEAELRVRAKSILFLSE
jgi:hypothetical protein